MIQVDGPVALRALARAFGHLGDFDRFVQALQRALEASPRFRGTSIRLDRGLESGFGSGQLVLPLAGMLGEHGVLEVPSGAGVRPFDAEDLHLLAGLADFLAAILDQAVRMQDAERSRELLRFLLNQAPIGLAAYTPERRLLVANELAAQWLGDAGPPFLEIESGAGHFHLRVGGKLVYGEARRAPDGVWVVALHDLTPGQVRLMETLQRETFRGLVEHRPVSFALVESPEVRDGVLRRLPELREILGGTGVVGPYDANRVGVVLAGAGGAVCRERLRRWQSIFADVGVLRVGVAELGRDGDSPDMILEAALRRSGPYVESVRPAVLVHDDDPGVTAAVELLLRRDYRVVRSSDAGRTREQLRREEFDLFLTELDLRGACGGIELAEEARAMQPAIKPLFMSVRQPPHELPASLAVTGAAVLQKPFEADEFREAVRNRLAT